MGLFSKSPAEKKLNELTGGIFLSDEFRKRLRLRGLSDTDGMQIKSQLKQEIKSGKVTEDGLNVRITHLINEKSVSIQNKYKDNNTQSNVQSKRPVAQKSLHDRKIDEYRQNSYMDCPNCGETILKVSAKCKFCHVKLDGNGKIIDEKYMICPACSTKVYGSPGYCPTCRYDFIKKKATRTKVCPVCFKVVPEIADVCPNCSADLTRNYGQNVYSTKSKKTQICPNCEKEIDEGVENCPYCNFLVDDLIQNSGSVHKLLDKKRNVAFLYNQKHNIKTCPECKTIILNDDDFCYSCGKGFAKKQETPKEVIEESKNDELSDLEKLYSKNVKSKYSANFKFAYVKYLDAFSKNASDKTIERIARLYDTTPNKLLKQAKEDKYIDLAPPINGAYSLKVSDLKDILKANNLKVSGKKDELIQRIDENLDEKELKRLFPKKTYQITDDAKEFLYENNYILFLIKNKSIGDCFYPSEVESSVESRHYSDEELCDVFERLLKDKLDYVISDGRWIDYKSFLNGLIGVYEVRKDYDLALECYFKIFLYDLNNYSPGIDKAAPKYTSLSSKLIDPLTDLLHTMSLSIDELKKRFEDTYNDVSHEMVIELNDALIYLLKAFNGEDLNIINSEINRIYSNPY